MSEPVPRDPPDDLNPTTPPAREAKTPTLAPMPAQTPSAGPAQPDAVPADQTGPEPEREGPGGWPSTLARPPQMAVDPLHTAETLPPDACRPTPADPYLTVVQSGSSDTGPWRDGGLGAVRIPGYQILEELGRGGMGVVYRARHLGLNRVVALKMILSGAYAGDEALQRFHGEAEAVARLKHPNIVQVHDIGETDGRPFFSLEYVEGGSLAGRLNGTPLAPRQAAQVVETLARAIHSAHAHGILHRDLKPANVLLSGPADAPLEKCVPKITDFGLAKRLEGESGQTHSGVIMGTPSYMAPEQAQGRVKDLGPPADVYALGVILYELLTGRPPFKAATAFETLALVLTEEPVPPKRLQPHVPRDLETICLKAMHKEPAKRYARAEDLAEDLRRFQQAEPILACPVNVLERALKWARRRPAAAALAGVCLLAAAGFLSMGVLFTLRLEDERGKAEAGRGEAVQALQRSEALRYAIGIGLAQRELEAGNLSHAEEVLKDCQPAMRDWEHRYLVRLYRDKKQALQEGPAPIRALCFSPDGRRLGTASGNGMVKLWDAGTGAVLQLFKGHTGAVSSVRFSPDGKHLASCGNDGTVRVWDAESGREIQTLRGHTDWVWGVCYSPDGRRLASAAEDQLVKVWDAETGAWIHDLKGHTEPVRGVCFSPDGRHLASAGEDETVRIWNTQTFDEAVPARKHQDKVVSLCYSPDGRRLASACKDGTVWVWDAEKGAEILRVKGHDGAVSSLGFSPDGKWLASAGQDKKVKVWDATGQEVPWTGREEAGWGYGVCFSPDGRHLASGNQEGAVQIWEVAGGRTLTLTEQAPKNGQMCVSPDGKWLASAVGGTEVKLWSTRNNRDLHTLEGHTGKVRSICFSSDSRRLASAGGDKTVKVWDVQTGRQVLTLTGHAGPVFSVCFSPDGKWLASAGGDKTVRIWDVQAGKAERTLEGHTGAVFSVCFSPDGKWLASAGMDRAIKLWDVETWELKRPLEGHSGPVRSLCFSPDSGRLASAGADYLIKVWDVGTGEEKQQLRGYTAWSICFLLNGQRLASVGADRTLRVWDLAASREIVRQKPGAGEVWDVCPDRRDQRPWALGREADVLKVWESTFGEEIRSLRPTSRGVKSVCFSPDGRFLVSANDNRTRRQVRRWDRREHHLSGEFGDADEKSLLSVCMSRDGRRLAAAGEGKIVKVWDVQTGRKVLTLTGHAGPVFSVCFSPDGKWLASASKDRTIKVWDADAGGEARTLTDHAGWVRSVCFSPDGRHLASAGEDKTVKLWDVRTWKVERTFEGHAGPVFSVCVSPDGKWLASGSGDHTARLWDAETGKELRIYKSTSTLFSVCFSPNGRRLVSGNREGAVQVWDTRNGLEPTLELKVQSGEVWSVCFSPDGHMLASAGQVVKKWDAGPDR